MEVTIAEIPGPNVIEKLIQVRATYPDDQSKKTATAVRHLKEIPEVENRIFFIAEDLNGNPIAYVQLILKNVDSDPTLAKPGEIGHIHDLRVAFHHQRKGVATRLLKHLEEKARELQLKTLTLGVDGSNKRAQKIYKLLGFRIFRKVVSRSPLESVFYMQKPLVQAPIQNASQRDL